MAERKSAVKVTKKAARARTATNGRAGSFSDEERAAMRERAKELRAEGRGRGAGKADGEAILLAKIAAMPAADRTRAERLHAVIQDCAPGLSPRTWYGMPAYARDGKVVCFFRAAQMFKERYMTFGFTQDARLDEGALWPTAYALTELTPAVEARIRALVKKAVG